MTSSSTSRRRNGRLFELQPVRFDLREVEDVVEDAEQVARRRMRDADVLMRLGRRDRVSSASAFMFRMAFIGVRISWLIIARNEPFARLASTACSRAATSSRCDACSAATASSMARPSSRNSPAAFGEARSAPRGCRPRPASRREDRTQVAEEERFADEPCRQEADERGEGEKHEVAPERGIHRGAIWRERDAERDTAAGRLAAVLQRFRDIQAARHHQGPS